MEMLLADSMGKSIEAGMHGLSIQHFQVGNQAFYLLETA